ncbi:DUF1566 domain-containing protein [Alteromonas flava]|uniref:Lcl C-terminal domain-containing protein n=1 Tax=Alteromonas flava TaxID=2048003 RepID=UPI000C28C271|nr:DUF1566 domain-containing protein [Alteromonas flava]
MVQAVCRYILLIWGLTVLTGCGGGSSDAPGSTLFVNAGPDRQVSELSTVVLSGQVQSDSTSLSYTWTASPTVTIDHPDRTVSNATFVAPEVTEITPYTLTLRVTDDSGNTVSDETIISVAPINEAPVADIQLEPWPGLDNGIYPAGETLLLDGSGSNDPDNASSDAIVVYEWQQLAGADVLDGVVTDAVTLSITTPIALQSQQLDFRLTVTDSEGAQSSDEISFFIQSESDTIPQVTAGADHAVFSGETIILNGTATTSVPRAEPLEVLWRVDSGQVVAIDSPTIRQTYAVAPQVSSLTNVRFSLSATDAFANQVEDTLIVQVRPQPITALNDTGVSQQATLSQNTSVHQGDYPGQDGQRGQDMIAANGQLEKAGRGDQGFDFTRLNQNGDEVDDIAQPWRCVRDNITGLVWEIKTEDPGLHAYDNTYSWYQEEDNGGFEGVLNGPDTQCTLPNCNTTDFVQAVNAEGLCGFFDWRLPRHDELLSIVHYGLSNMPMVDADYFPFSGDINAAPLWYWTSQPNADGVQDDEARSAWAIDFASGTDNFLNKQSAVKIRLVRAGR